MAKKTTELTTAELTALGNKLLAHRGDLLAKLANIDLNQIDFDTAVELRDNAQFLCSTVHAIGLLDLAIQLATMTGKASPGFNPKDCGLEP